MQVDFMARLRGTRRFEGVAELLEQIRLDVEQARSLAS
jgi:FAD synthase